MITWVVRVMTYDMADEVGEINLLFGRGDIGPISVN